MDSNVSHYKYDPLRDAFETYDGIEEPKETLDSQQHPPRPAHVYGQISFDAPWIFLPDFDGHTSLKHVSLDQIEFEMERSARRQED